MLLISKTKSPDLRPLAYATKTLYFWNDLIIACFPKQKEKWLTHSCGQSDDGWKKRNLGVLLFEKRFHFYVHFCGRVKSRRKAGVARLHCAVIKNVIGKQLSPEKNRLRMCADHQKQRKQRIIYVMCSKYVPDQLKAMKSKINSRQ